MKQAVTLNIKLGKIMDHSLVDRLFTLDDLYDKAIRDFYVK
jgi:hypothetical protein